MEHQVVSPSETPFLGSAYRVDLDFFEGPLDLLLHLVQRHEVSVAEVDMSQIAEQYLQIVLQAQELDLDIATEYLVVAATLLAIKSELVLPGGRIGAPEEGFDDGSGVYEELRERLRQYERFKQRALELHGQPQLGFDTFVRVDRTVKRQSPELVIDEDDTQSLAVLFVRLLKRIGGGFKSFRIRLEAVSIVEYTMRLLDALRATSSPQGFIHIVGRIVHAKRSEAVGGPSEVPARSAVIGGFLAVLELVKRGLMHVSQPTDSADIELKLQLLEGSAEDILNEDFIFADEEESLAEERAGNDNIVELPSSPQRRVRRSGLAIDDDMAVAEVAELKEVNRG